MKKILLLVFLNVYVNGICQFVDFTPSISTPHSIVKYGNDFYISSFSDEKVYKFDTSNSLTIFYSTNSTGSNISPTHLLIDSNQLYVGINDIANGHKINLLNLLNNPLTSSTIFNGSTGPIIKYGNYLFIGDFTNSMIYKYNILTSVTTTFLTGIKPSYFSLKNNELFITSNQTNNVQKVNLDSLNPTTTSLVTSLNHAAGICYDSNYFYIANSNTSRINIYDINTWNYTGFYNLPTNSYPNDIKIIDGYLYACLTSANKVVRLNITLGLQEIQNTSNEILIFPNPTTNYIIFQNKDNTSATFNYEITDLTGRIIKSSNTATFNEQINTDFLTTGNYIIKIETENRGIITKKLMKK